MVNGNKYNNKEDIFNDLDSVLGSMSMALEKSDILQLISGIKEMDELAEALQKIDDVPEKHLKQLLAFRVRAKILLNKINSMSKKGENLINIIKKMEEDSTEYDVHGRKNPLSTGIDSKG